MEKCPVHPQFFKTDNTPCPACREAFNSDIPVQPSGDWLRGKLQDQFDENDDLQEELNQLKDTNFMYGALAIIGWAIVVVSSAISILREAGLMS